MQFMGDAYWWDKRLAARTQRLLPPEPALVSNLERLKHGRALDIACGDGRNALYLAENGFLVTAVDFSAVALERLQAFAAERGLEVETRLVDLLGAGLSGLGEFDTIVVNHYRLPPLVVAVLPDHLTPGGTLFLNGFCALPAGNTAMTQDDLLDIEDYAVLEESCTSLIRQKYKTELGSFLMLIYQKK